MKVFRNLDVKKEFLISGILCMAALALGGAWCGWKGGLLVFVLCLSMSGIHIVFHYCRYGKIAALADEVRHVLHSTQTAMIDIQEEGELSVLQSEIQKLFKRLSIQSMQLREDKVFLMDSIADISHQIRTPLTSMNLIASRLCQPGVKPAEQRQLIQELSRLLRHIDWLVQSLLKMAKLDADAISLKQEKVSVQALVSRIYSELEITAELHSQTWVREIDSGVSFTGDFHWTYEALANIIKNCMEHTPDGGVIRVQAEENELYTQIHITDNGPGIAANDLPHLFERFYKGENAGEHGIGIGLALAKMIIERQRGSLTAQNSPGGGASFIIRFHKAVV